MTDKQPQKLKIKKHHPERCQVKGCKEKGGLVTLDVMDGSAAEFEAILCEKHHEGARGCGQ